MKNKNVDKRIQLRSYEVRDILTIIPNKIIRYGITIISAILILIFSLTFFIKYPDIISGRFYIQSSNPPVFLLARSSGRIIHLDLTEKDSVHKGQLIAVIENSADYKSYLYLKKIISISDKLPKENEVKLNLGELQNYYADFIEKCHDIYRFKATNYHSKKLHSLEQERKELQTLINTNNAHFNATKKGYELAEKLFYRDSLLFNQKTIAIAAYEKSCKKLIQEKISLHNSSLAVSSSKIALSKLEQSIISHKLNYQEKYNHLFSLKNKSLSILQGAINEWEKKYCLISPIDGKVTFSNIWKANQNIRTGELVVTILPHKKNDIIAKVNIPVNRAGKLKTGQVVNLKLFDFPYREYGMLIGNLNSISEVPDSLYIGTIILSDSLITNYGKNLPFKQNMKGNAEIITENHSIAERILFPMKDLMKNITDHRH